MKRFYTLENWCSVGLVKSAGLSFTGERFGLYVYEHSENKTMVEKGTLLGKM